MTNPLRIELKVGILLIMGIVLAVTGENAFAAEPLEFGTKVTVALQSGRKFTGQLDPRSDAQRLWLRFGDAGTSVLRPIVWEHVVTAKNAATSATISSDELLATVVRLRGNAEVIETPSARRVITVPPRTSLPAAELSVRPTGFVEASPARNAPRPIRGLYFDAYLDGWFGNSPQHGLTIVVRPFDDFQQTVPVNGTLEILLLAPQRRDFSAAPRSSGLVVQRIGHWQMQTQADQFGAEGLAVHLQLRSASINSLSSSIPYGLVQVRLTVPGVGVLEKTRDDVRLQSFSPIRDLYEQQSQRRSLPFARIGQ